MSKSRSVSFVRTLRLGNNPVEVWHSTVKDDFQSIKSVWKFIIACQISAQEEQLKAAQIENNSYKVNKTTAQKKKESVIKHVTSEYEAGNLTEMEVCKALMNYMI